MIAQYPDSRNGRAKRMTSQNLPHVRRAPDRLQAAWIGFQFKARGISQEAIAKRTGVSPQMVNQVIHGLRTSARVQRAVAMALGFTSWSMLLATRPEIAA